MALAGVDTAKGRAWVGLASSRKEHIDVRVGLAGTNTAKGGAQVGLAARPHAVTRAGAATKSVAAAPKSITGKRRKGPLAAAASLLLSSFSSSPASSSHRASPSPLTPPRHPQSRREDLRCAIVMSQPTVLPSIQMEEREEMRWREKMMTCYMTGGTHYHMDKAAR